MTLSHISLEGGEEYVSITTNFELVSLTHHGEVESNIFLGL
jgi:hypothetical protein